jgi:hypothetical protein
MAQYQATIVAPLEISEAFDYLARFNPPPSGTPAQEAEMVTPEPVGVGSVPGGGHHRRAQGALRYEVTEFVRPYRVTVRAENGSTISEDTITFTPADRRADDDAEGAHTEVRYDADLQLKARSACWSGAGAAVRPHRRAGRRRAAGGPAGSRVPSDLSLRGRRQPARPPARRSVDPVRGRRQLGCTTTVYRYVRTGRPPWAEGRSGGASIRATWPPS